MIRTPPGWGADVITRAYRSMTLTSDVDSRETAGTPAVRRIGGEDLRWALNRGWDDFKASRSDVVFLCVLYPAVGLVLARLAFGYQMLPLVFPLASGFALLGPLAAVGLNEMSRRREMGLSAGWADAFKVFRSPSIHAIALLGLALMMLFVFWLLAAQIIYNVTLGPKPPISVDAFAHDLLHTRAGVAMAFAGCATGFVFAAVALAVGAVSFPMLLDRKVSLETAVTTSIHVVRRNPVTMAKWGIIITLGLVAGSIPLLLGLMIVMPVLGHATWHLYRRVVIS
nr:DUF2189 domain-containing protein [uncultured Rhodopila sp.]